MPLDAEPTRFVHNELLEAWADGGIFAAMLLLALLVRLLPRGAGGSARAPEDSLPPPGGSARAWAGAAALLVLMPLFGACGMLASNLEWWPGAGGDAGWLAWMLAVAAAGGAAVVAAERLPLPPPWAWRLAVLACALHCLIDFDLHSPGVRGCLAIIACLAAGPARSLAITAWRQRAATLAAAVVFIGLALGLQRAVDLGEGEAIAARLQEVARAQAAGAPADEAMAALSAQLALSAPADAEPGGAPAIIGAALARLDEVAWRWPRASGLAAEALALRPPGSQRLELGERLRRLMPGDAGLGELQAQDLAALGRYPEAIAAERAAVACAPANLARRLALARLLDRAGDHDPAQAAALHRAAGAERALAEALRAVVHPRNLP